MRFDYIEAFVDSASEALSKTLQGPVKKGELDLKSSPIPSRGVATIIGITGDVEGRVIFDMESETARRLAEALNDSRFPDLTSLVLDTISELSNIMIGNAVSRLNDHGYQFKVTPPTVFTGTELSTTDIKLETLVIPLSTSYGEVAVNVAMREH
jgi:chemotaxis protein CheX